MPSQENKRILVKDLLNIKPIKEITSGDFFMFQSGKRIHKVYFIEANEVFYTNLLTKKSGKIKINTRPNLSVISVSHIFNIEQTACPF